MRGIAFKLQSLFGLKKKATERTFAQDAEAYVSRIRKYVGDFSSQRKGTRVGVLVTPWMRTAAPFFSLECARILETHGVQAVLLWDTANVTGNASKYRENEALRRVIDELRERFEVCEPGEAIDNEPVDLKALAFENAVRQSRGEQKAREYLTAHPDMVGRMQEHYAKVLGMLRKVALERLLVPGGILGLSGIYLAAARAEGILVTTYDSGTGLLAMDHSGVAAHYGDLERAWKKAREIFLKDERLREKIRRAAHESLEVRMHGKDRFQLQQQAPEESEVPACDVLVPLNYRVDAAAMLRGRVFRDVGEWLNGILDWLEKHDGVTAVIRQHPCERMPLYKGHDDWGSLIRQRPTLQGRVRYVPAEEPLNTYAVMQKCRVVVPYTSRTGVEAAMCGLPVVLATRCYYSETDFVTAAETREQFFKALNDAIEGRLSPTESQRDSAALMYFLLERCSLLKTPFTPAIANYRKWVEVSPAEFMNQEGLSAMVRVLMEREPIPSVLFEKEAA